MLYVPFVFGPSFVCQQIRCQPDGIRAGCCQERSSSVRRRSSFIGGQTEENNAKELIPGLSHFSWIFKEDTRVCWQNKRGKLLPGSSQDTSPTSRKISSPRCLARCRTRLDGLRILLMIRPISLKPLKSQGLRMLHEYHFRALWLHDFAQEGG